ncbi:hypothetical protein, partial [Streptomyces globisporus]|uniref:AMP-binding enzyme n=1 Tax=Streptomyces globisporus TaxID=1908 RepID=UPI00055EEDDB
FRVEPGETEAALLTHPAVTQAVVTVHHEQLAAYVVTSSRTDSDEIRRHVADRLPEHLVPTHVIVLERLPLTPNGKVDKRALPEPAPVASAGRAPRTPLEETGQGGGEALPPLVAGEGAGDTAPASFAQRRLWLLSELEGDSAAYNVPMVVRCEGGLDVGA